MGGWEINQRASGDASTCSLLEQRPGGSGGILISSGDMFLTFSENKAARETENTMVRLLVSTRAAFPSPCWPASPRTSRTARICSMVPRCALRRCLITTKMCLQPLIELPRNNKKSFLCLFYVSCVANAHCGMQPFWMRHGALDMAPGWCQPMRPLHHWLGASRCVDWKASVFTGSLSQMRFEGGYKQRA